MATHMTAVNCLESVSLLQMRPYALIGIDTLKIPSIAHGECCPVVLGRTAFLKGGFWGFVGQGV